MTDWVNHEPFTAQLVGEPVYDWLIDVYVPGGALSWARQYYPDFKLGANWIFKIGASDTTLAQCNEGVVVDETPWTDPKGRVGAIMRIMLGKAVTGTKIFKIIPKEISEQQREEFWNFAVKELSFS
jgi:hypothetical protein